MGNINHDLSQLILLNAMLLGSVITITMGNFVHLKYTLVYTMLRPRANSLICQSYERSSVLFRVCYLNPRWRTGNQWKTDPSSRRHHLVLRYFSQEKKMKMLQEELVTLGRT